MTFLDGAWSIIILPVGRDWVWQRINDALGEKARTKSAKKSPERGQEVLVALVQRSGRFSGSDRGIQLSRRRHYFSGCCLAHFRAVVPPSVEDRFPLASLAGRRPFFYSRRIGEDHFGSPRLARFAVAGYLGALAFYISRIRPAFLGGLLYHFVLFFCRGPTRSLPEIAWSPCSRPFPRPDIRLQKSLCRSPWDASKPRAAAQPGNPFWKQIGKRLARRSALSRISATRGLFVTGVHRVRR
jgi:hypothetical protein